ncbi:small secreted protein [Pseudomassariella vexata]|uniref:Small secreted protein n=1 Tax=Pseudomassariella vexata TaxID=1141098 RepID=A0A1Y2E6T0_9PEZI|nr:small secreted protein [Pseudomassariella vexata]ORY66986.1 small secreted protein [Pseudomassariella vexata]
MRFTTAFVAAFAASAIAAPTSLSNKAHKRGVFTTQTYNDISISGGVAGNAEAEALAVFSALDIDNADEADIDFLSSVNSICNDAEEGAFNPAIDEADGEEADALQRGKIKNKVLKLEATLLRLQIEQAQGADVADEIAAEQKKLDNNISQDVEAAGLPSTALEFDATTA